MLYTSPDDFPRSNKGAAELEKVHCTVREVFLYSTDKLGNLSCNYVSMVDLSVIRWHRLSYQVSRWHPPPLLHHPLRILINLRRRLRHLVHRDLIPSPRTLDIAQRLLQTPQLHLHLSLRRLRVLHRHLLEGLDTPELLVHIVRLGLESFEVLLNLVDDLRVLEDGAIVTKVDGGGLVGELLDAAAGVIVAFLEV